MLYRVSVFSLLSSLLCYLCHMSVNFHGNGLTDRQVLYSCWLKRFALFSVSVWCVFWSCLVFMCLFNCASFLKGERLRISANKCCPECISSSQGSCQYEGVIYGVSKNDIYIYRERGFLFKPLKAFACCLPQKSVLSRVKKHL